jgi:hypothetical protein
MKTPFEQTLEQVRLGQLKTPKVSTAEGNIDYFGYQLAVHKYNLSLMSLGLTCKGIKLSELKRYYGLKGRSAKKCLPQFLDIMNNYKQSLTA